MGKIKKLVKKVNPALGKAMDVGDKVLGTGQKAGDGNDAEAAAIKAASDAQVAAQNEANRIAAETARNQAELANINKNYATDLSLENRALVETGGTANDAASMDNPDQKRRRPTSGLASTLGISV